MLPTTRNTLFPDAKPIQKTARFFCLCLAVPIIPRNPLLCILLALGSGLLTAAKAQDHSVARKWNEALLEAIENDFARPPVHARNLYHTSIALYDAWAVYDETASVYFLNHTHGNFYCPFFGISLHGAKKAAQEEAMSYAAFRLLSHRFKNSPGYYISLHTFSNLMASLGYDTAYTYIDYFSGSPAALGNYLGKKLIEFGLKDGANEREQYRSLFYEPVNAPFNPFEPGDPTLTHPNRWQPIGLGIFIDQSGQVVGNGASTFLNPEWGGVVPFSLQEQDLIKYKRDGHVYPVYHDPGEPPSVDQHGQGRTLEYLWNFALVAIWSSHLDDADEVMIDISPGSQGNISTLPKTFDEYKNFYDLFQGGDKGKGYALNPSTGQPYTAQWVKRGDYVRVLAEFWADGPNSLTPPGHWFDILHHVDDHPLFEKRFAGAGDVMDDLEWDVKAYFTLGGGMHDAAVTAWGIKGYYDYVRPVSAIRAMASRGQCSDPSLPYYHPAGMPLYPGYIEQVGEGDELVGHFNENLGKIKVRAWRGPGYIFNPLTEKAGVDWILGEHWWPYQRPSFVTPPFAGYISGHSTFSRTAAEIMTRLTGSEFFPGGVGEFHAGKNEFLVFEEGPGEDVILQWARYADASDQCSLSRIWGGIHPPVDDIPGREIGKKLGADVFAFATRYFKGEVKDEFNTVPRAFKVYPNPVSSTSRISIDLDAPIGKAQIVLTDITGRTVYEKNFDTNFDASVYLPELYLKSGTYILIVRTGSHQFSQKVIFKE